MTTLINDTIAIPNFAEAHFFCVDNRPGTMIVELLLGNGAAVSFCIMPDALMEFGLRCYAQAKLHLGEVESDDDVVQAIDGRSVN